MSAALVALQEVIKTDPRPYKNLIPSFTSILKQVRGWGGQGGGEEKGTSYWGMEGELVGQVGIGVHGGKEESDGAEGGCVGGCHEGGGQCVWAVRREGSMWRGCQEGGVQCWGAVTREGFSVWGL